MGKVSDSADALPDAGGRTNYYFPCVDRILDVSATTTDGTNYSLTVGKVAVATLTLTAPARVRAVRSWDPNDDVPTADLVVSGTGSASFNQADLNAIRMATPGASGSVTLNFGMPQSLSYGPQDIPRTQSIGNTRRTDQLAVCNAKTVPDLATAAPATADFQFAATAPDEFHLPDQGTADGLKQSVVDLNSAIDDGDFLKAHATAATLELPFPEDDAKYVDFDAFTEMQWQLAYAVGGATAKRLPNGSFRRQYDAKKKSMIGLQGTGNYLELI